MPQLVLQNVKEYERLQSTLSSLLGHTNKIFQALGDEHLKVKKYSIEQSHIPVLLFLYFLGQRSQQDIANDVRRDKSSIQRTVSLLAKKNIVSIAADGFDKRKNVVRLTNEGRQMCERLITDIEELDRELFSCLDAQEKTILYSILQKLIRNSSTYRNLNELLPPNKQ